MWAMAALARAGQARRLSSVRCGTSSRWRVGRVRRRLLPSSSSSSCTTAPAAGENTGRRVGRGAKGGAREARRGGQGDPSLPFLLPPLPLPHPPPTQVFEGAEEVSAGGGAVPPGALGVVLGPHGPHVRRHVLQAQPLQPPRATTTRHRPTRTRHPAPPPSEWGPGTPRPRNPPPRPPQAPPPSQAPPRRRTPRPHPRLRLRGRQPRVCVWAGGCPGRCLSRTEGGRDRRGAGSRQD